MNERIDKMYQQVIDEVCANPLYRFAELVAADEREACAKLCEELRDEDGYECWGTECAVAIRARDMSTKPQNNDTFAKHVHAIDESIHEPWVTSDIAHRTGGLSVEESK